MEGPTPVSALIHAATMVTAGVFVIYRCSSIFQQTFFSSMILTILGSITCFVAGVIGVFQNDMKRIIAYSTCSQLGYMVFICGLSNYNTSFFHLTNHAFFKAALFLSAGVIIHSFYDEQDLRKMGSAFKFLFLAYVLLLINSLNLMGFPFLSGFFSKELIIELSATYLSVDGIFAYILGNLAAFITAFYSIKLLSKVFLSNGPSGFKKIYNECYEGSS
jgi:NADH-ubiquinone oxidoreductase chain 5